MLALSQSNDPILTEQAFVEKECKLNKDDTNKTRNNFLINYQKTSLQRYLLWLNY